MYIHYEPVFTRLLLSVPPLGPLPSGSTSCLKRSTPCGDHSGCTSKSTGLARNRGTRNVEKARKGMALGSPDG